MSKESRPRAAASEPKARPRTTVVPRSSPEWERRKAAATKYRPKTIRLLVVSEAPPREGYFYFETGGPADPLFELLAEVIFEQPPGAGDRALLLKELRRRGVFVIELKPDAPREAGDSLAPYADWLPTRVETLAPAQVMLMGSAVHDAAYQKLKKAGLAVASARIESLAPGDSKEARGELRRALVRAGLEKLIRARRPTA